MDALPIPTWVPFLSKLIALWMMEAVILAAIMLAGMAYQTAIGFHRYEPCSTSRSSSGSGPYFVFTAVLALVVHAVVSNKYVGHVVMVCFYLFGLFQDRLGLEHTLFRYGDHPSVTYSDMNGFGHFVRPMVYYDLCWAGVAVILAVLGSLMWTRGTRRASGAASRSRGRVSRGPPCWSPWRGSRSPPRRPAVIIYNTHVLHTYRTAKAEEALQADYEKQYKRLENAPQPRITGVEVGFDIFPETETLEARGTSPWRTRPAEPIDTVYVRSSPESSPQEALRRATPRSPVAAERVAGFYMYELAMLHRPRRELPRSIRLGFHDTASRTRATDTRLVENGTFFNSECLPHLGYQADAELRRTTSARSTASRRGIMPDRRRPAGLANNLISPDANWITFDATVSTSADQIAIAPGYLEQGVDRERPALLPLQDGREDPRLLLACYSARYEVRRGQARRTSTSRSTTSQATSYDLDGWSRDQEVARLPHAKFGPYQHHQVRIVEFPRYERSPSRSPTPFPTRSRSASSRGSNDASPTTSTTRSTSRRTRWPPVVGAPGDRRRGAGRDAARRDAGAVLGAHGDEEAIRRRGKMRRFLKHELDGTSRARLERRRRCRSCGSRTRPTSTTTRGAS